MLALKIPIPSPMARARCIVEAITFPQLLLKGCEEGLLSGSYSRLSLVLAPGRSSEFSVFRALASQPRPEPCLSKFEGVGCEGCPVLSPASGDSNHNNHEGCLSLHKSSSRYIKPSASSGGGIQAGMRCHEGGCGTPSFFCSSGVVSTRTTRNRFVAQTSWSVDSGVSGVPYQCVGGFTPTSQFLVPTRSSKSYLDMN